MGTTQALDDIRRALHGADHSLRLVRVYFGPSKWAVQVYAKGRKVGPMLLPPDGGTVVDVLDMLDRLIAPTEAGEPR